MTHVEHMTSALVRRTVQVKFVVVRALCHIYAIMGTTGIPLPPLPLIVVDEVAVVGELSFLRCVSFLSIDGPADVRTWLFIREGLRAQSVLLGPQIRQRLSPETF